MDRIVENAVNGVTSRTSGATLLSYLLPRLRRRVPSHLRSQWPTDRIEKELRSAFRFTTSPAGPVVHGLFIHPN